MAIEATPVPRDVKNFCFYCSILHCLIMVEFSWTFFFFFSVLKQFPVGDYSCQRVRSGLLLPNPRLNSDFSIDQLTKMILFLFPPMIALFTQYFRGSGSKYSEQINLKAFFSTALLGKYSVFLFQEV